MRPRKVLLAAGCALAIVAGASGMAGDVAEALPITNEWTGAVNSSDWEKGGNWSLGVSPHATHDVLITSGNGSPANIPAGAEAASLTVSRSISGGSLTITNGLTWTGGRLAVDINVLGGASAISGGTGMSLSGDLTLAGSTSMSAPAVEVDAPFAITNLGTLTFVAGSGAGFTDNSCCTNPGRLVNHGTVSIPGSTDTVVFHNIGYESTGTTSVATGSTLQVDGGPVMTWASHTLEGGGRTLITAGTDLTMTGITTIEVGHTLEVAGTLTDLFGTVAPALPALITGEGDLVWSGGSFRRAIVVDADIITTVTGPIAKTMQANATLAFEGEATVESGASLVVVSGSVLTNDGTLVLEPGGAVTTGSCCANVGRVINNGTLQVPAGGGTALIQVGLDTAGFISVGSGSVLRLEDAPSTWESTTLQGLGKTQIADGADVVLGAIVTIGTGHTLEVTDPLTTVLGHNPADGGDVNGPGTLAWTGGGIGSKVRVNAPMTISGAGSKTVMTGGSLQLNGATQLTGGSVGVSGDLTNAGSLTAGPATAITSSSGAKPILNAGTYTVAAGSGQTHTLGVHLDQQGILSVASGTLQINGLENFDQTAGSTTVIGAMSGSAQVNVRGGTITGSGFVGHLRPRGPSGVLAPPSSGGVLAATQLTIDGGGTHQAAIDGTVPGSGHSQVAVSGSASLNGTLAVATSIDPAIGNSFRIQTHGSRTGTYAIVTGVDLGPGEAYGLVYAPTFMDLVVGEPTTTTVAANPLTQAPGQPVTLTATVSRVAGDAVTSGLVTFRSGTSVLGSANLNAAGQASLVTSSIANGTHTIAAVFDGSNSLGWSRGTIQVTIAAPTGRPVADFGGDGFTDIGIFRPDVGGWYVQGQPTVFQGLPGDIPVPGYYDINATADRAVFRPSVGGWYVEGQSTVFWGLPGDIPVPADYTGDGITDRAVYRPSAGGWYINGQPTVFWGVPGDIPVPGDYDGNGSIDIAVYRPSVGGWYIKDQHTVYWGLSDDIPVPGDYDGNGSTDTAVFRPSSGAWLIKDQTTVFLGLSSDIPVPGDYSGSDAAEPAVFRPDTGAWFIEGQPTVFHGLPGDIPTPKRPSP